MLRKIRIILATLFFALVTLLFLDFTGTIHRYFSWVASVQFLPAVMAVNVAVIVGLLVLTLLFGRVYCSVICPMGVFQDLVSWISGKRKGKNLRFSYSKGKHWLRYGMLVLFIACMVAGIGAIVSILAPYSSYGRIVSNLLAPVYGSVNNVFAYFAERADSYAFYEVDVHIKSIATFIVSVVTFVLVAVLAWRNGRTYCNTICPVGTVLGFFARFSLLKPYIDTTKCINCKKCSRTCKASCIDSENHKIDYSRCVACMDCLESCSKGAIKYGRVKLVKVNVGNEKVDSSRRQFMAIAGAAVATAALHAEEKTVDGGLAVLEDKKVPNRNTPLVPGGAVSLDNFTQHCTACQLCVSACPNGVLRPSQSLDRFMQPEMSYETGFCRPECTRCAEVCPTDAIRPLPKEEKMMRKIGTAKWVKENCIVLRDGVACGNCERHCPNGAIVMAPLDENNPDSPKFRVIDAERCIGCGACEYVCPARPFSAIYVDGVEIHRTI